MMKLILLKTIRQIFFFAEYYCKAVFNSVEVLYFLKKGKFDVIISDVKMSPTGEFLLSKKYMILSLPMKNI